MGGADKRQRALLVVINPAQRIPQGHPLRRIKALAAAARKELSPVFAGMTEHTMEARFAGATWHPLLTGAPVLDGALVPEDNLLPGVQGLRGPLSCLDQARYGIGWGAIGAAMACYDTALSYAKQRKQFNDRPIASHQLVQEKLVWMITEITKAQFLALHVGRLKDHGRVHPSPISMLKMNNVWMARETARLAREVLGANGIVDDYVIMRHMNNLESVYTYEGTHDIHKLVIGERITGISAFI